MSLAGLPDLLLRQLPPADGVVVCDPVRVWRTAPDTAARVAIWVRWVTWAMTLGRAGQLPWVWELRPRHFTRNLGTH